MAADIRSAPGGCCVIWGRLVRRLIRVDAMQDLVDHGRTSIFLFMMMVFAFPYESLSAATLVLTDGTVIHGEIKTLEEGVYTVETDSLGTLRVRQEHVRTIDQISEGERVVESTTDGSSPRQAELQAMQSRMLRTPSLLSMIQALQNDPEVQAILADPEIVSALASGNYDALMSNPKIVALTDNSKVREIINEVN